MAYIDATILVKYQSDLAQSESRRSPLGIIDLFKRSTPFADYISPDLINKFAEFSSDRPFTIPTIIPQSPTVVTTPGFSFIPDNLTQSAEHTFVMYDVFSGFRHYPSMYANNIIKADFDLKTKLDNVLYAMANTTEGILSTTLDARKSQVMNYLEQINHNSGGGTYAFTGADILTVDEAGQQATMFAPLDSLMTANEIGGNYAVVTSPAGLTTQKLEALNFGQANSKNVQAWGMLAAEDMHTSQNISTSAVFDGYYVRKGAVAMYPNYPYDFREGTTVGTSEWAISDMEMPYLKHKVNVFTRTFNADASALTASGTDTNTIMSHGEEMGIWFRFVVVYRPNTLLTTITNDVVKIQGLTS
jgi:hypothetical protein